MARELVLRERVELLRDLAAVLREGFAAPVEAALPALRAPEADEDLARVDVDFFAAPVDRDDVVERELAARVPVERFAVERDVVALGAPLEREEAPDDFALLPPLLAEPSKLHLPDITRCAASATASAMIEPSLVALDTTLLAACDAVSAASNPASRIFLRAAGLALIAAAAAASPAASISLLIAALASLSIVSLDRAGDDFELEPEELEPEELLRADLAIFYLPPSGQRHSNAVPVPK